MVLRLARAADVSTGLSVLVLEEGRGAEGVVRLEGLGGLGVTVRG